MAREKLEPVQRHHLSYEPEVVVPIYRKEHFTITKLDRYTRPSSVGFLTALAWFVLRKLPTAVKLEEKQK